jgi:ribonuclease VapC
LPRLAGSGRRYRVSRASVVGPPVACPPQIARQAFIDFGKGRDPANLNYGDCFSNALAKSMADHRLFKSADFAKTDVLAA